MRKTLCTLLYRLRLRRWAYKVSPSIYGYLYGQEVQAALVAGLAAVGGLAKALVEETTPKAAKRDGYRAKMQFADELHSPADRCVCCGEIIPEGRTVCPSCENGVTATEG